MVWVGGELTLLAVGALDARVWEWLVQILSTCEDRRAYSHGAWGTPWKCDPSHRSCGRLERVAQCLLGLIGHIELLFQRELTLLGAMTLLATVVAGSTTAASWAVFREMAHYQHVSWRLYY